MSGYASKADVIEVIVNGIETDWNKTGLSKNRRDYNISAIVRENFYHAPGWGWRASTEAGAADAYVASLRRNLRKRARV